MEVGVEAIPFAWTGEPWAFAMARFFDWTASGSLDNGLFRDSMSNIEENGGYEMEVVLGVRVKLARRLQR